MILRSRAHKPWLSLSWRFAISPSSLSLHVPTFALRSHSSNAMPASSRFREAYQPLVMRGNQGICSPFWFLWSCAGVSFLAHPLDWTLVVVGGERSRGLWKAMRSCAANCGSLFPHWDFLMITSLPPRSSRITEGSFKDLVFSVFVWFVCVAKH